LYQLTLDDFDDSPNPQNTVDTTPWDIIVNKHGGNYVTAIANALLHLESRFPFVRRFIEYNEYHKTDESVLNELVHLLSACIPTQDSYLSLYEHFMGKATQSFSTAKSGDFYTPIEIIRSISALLDFKQGTVYDPCCGSGAMLIVAAQMALGGSDLQLVGQTQDLETYNICQMNLILHNLDVDLGKQPANTLVSDQHANKTFDYIIANPPFNVSKWNEASPYHNDNRWRYGIPPRSNGNFAWLQHILSHLNESGRAAVILPNGTLTTRVQCERNIREAILCDGVVEAIITFPAGLFYNTNVPFCVWMLNRSQKHSNILMINGERLDPRIGKKFTTDNAKQIEELVESYRKGELQGKTETYAVVSLHELAQKDYILSPNWYTSSNYTDLSNLRFDLRHFEDCMRELKASLKGESILSYIEQWKQVDMTAISWTKAVLPDLYSIFGGIRKDKKYFGQGTPMLDMKTVIRYPFIPNTSNSYVQVTAGEIAKYNIQYGDIFLNRTSETNDTLAFCCVSTKDMEAVYNGFLHRLRPKDGQTIYPPYAAGYFRSAVYRREIEDISTVFTTRASMSQAKLSSISVYYPDWNTQRKIGDTLHMVFQYLQDNPGTKLCTLLMDFERLLIEQYITYPIMGLLEKEKQHNEKNDQS